MRGIFVLLAAHAAKEDKFVGEEDILQYWRKLKSGGLIDAKYPCDLEGQADLLESEGHSIDKGSAGKPKKVKDFEKKLPEF